MPHVKHMSESSHNLNRHILWRQEHNLPCRGQADKSDAG